MVLKNTVHFLYLNGTSQIHRRMYMVNSVYLCSIDIKNGPYFLTPLFLNECLKPNLLFNIILIRIVPHDHLMNFILIDTCNCDLPKFIGTCHRHDLVQSIDENVRENRRYHGLMRFLNF